MGNIFQQQEKNSENVGSEQELKSESDKNIADSLFSVSNENQVNLDETDFKARGKLVSPRDMFDDDFEETTNSVQYDFENVVFEDESFDEPTKSILHQEYDSFEPTEPRTKMSFNTETTSVGQTDIDFGDDGEYEEIDTNKPKFSGSPNIQTDDNDERDDDTESTNVKKRLTSNVKRVRRNTGVFRVVQRTDNGPRERRNRSKGSESGSDESPRNNNNNDEENQDEPDGMEVDQQDSNQQNPLISEKSKKLGEDTVDFQKSIHLAQLNLRKAVNSQKVKEKKEKSNDMQIDEPVDTATEESKQPKKKPKTQKQKKHPVKKEISNENDEQDDATEVEEESQGDKNTNLKEFEEEEIVDDKIKLKKIQKFEISKPSESEDVDNLKISEDVIMGDSSKKKKSEINPKTTIEDDKKEWISPKSQDPTHPKQPKTTSVKSEPQEDSKILDGDPVIGDLIKKSKKTFPYDNLGNINATNVNQRQILFFNYITGDFKNNCMMTSIRKVCVTRSIECTRMVLFLKEKLMFPTQSTTDTKTTDKTSELEKNIKLFGDISRKATGFWKHLKKVYKLYCKDIVSVFNYKTQKIVNEKSFKINSSIPLVPNLALKDPNLGEEFKEIQVDFKFFNDTEDRFGTKAVLFENSRMDIQILTSAICSYFKGGYKEMLPVLVNIRTDTRTPLYHQMEQLLTHFFVLLRKGFRFGKTFYLADAMGMGKTFQHILGCYYSSNLLGWLMAVQTIELFDPFKLSVIDFEAILFESDTVNMFYEWISDGFYAVQNPEEFKKIISELTYNRSNYECFKTTAGYLDYLKTEIMSLCNNNKSVLENAKTCKTYEEISSEDKVVLSNIFKSIKLLLLLRTSPSVSRNLDGQHHTMSYEAYLEKSKLIAKREKCLAEARHIIAIKDNIPKVEQELICKILTDPIKSPAYWHITGKSQPTIDNYFSKTKNPDQPIQLNDLQANQTVTDVSDKKSKKTKKSKSSKSPGEPGDDIDEFDKSEISARTLYDELPQEDEDLSKIETVAKDISLVSQNLRKIMENTDASGITANFNVGKDDMEIDDYDKNFNIFSSSSSSTSTTTTHQKSTSNSSDNQTSMHKNAEFREFVTKFLDKDKFFGSTTKNSLFTKDINDAGTLKEPTLCTNDVIINYMKEKNVPFKTAVITLNRHIVGSNTFTTFVSWTAVPKQFTDKFLPKKTGFLTHSEKRDETIYEFIRNLMGVPTRIMDFIYDCQTFGKSVSPILFCPPNMIDEWIREIKNVSTNPKIAILAGESLKGIGKKDGGGKMVYKGSTGDHSGSDSFYSPEDVSHCLTIRNYLMYNPSITLIHLPILNKMINQITFEIDRRVTIMNNIYCSDEELEKHCSHVSKLGVSQIMFQVLTNINQYIKLNFFGADMMSTFQTCKIAIDKFKAQFDSEKSSRPKSTTVFMKNLKWAIEGAELFLKTYDNIGYWLHILFSKFTTAELELLEPGIKKKSQELLKKVDEKIGETKNSKNRKITSSEQDSYIRELEIAKTIVKKHIEKVISNIKVLKKEVSQTAFEQLPAMSLYFMSNEYNIGVDEAHKLRTETSVQRSLFLKFPSPYRSFLSGTPINNRLGEEMQSFVNLFRSFGPWVRDREMSFYDVHKDLNFPEFIPTDMLSYISSMPAPKTPQSDNIVNEFNHDLDTISKINSRNLFYTSQKFGISPKPFVNDYKAIETSNSAERMMLMINLLLSTDSNPNEKLDCEKLGNLVTSEQFANLSSIMWYSHLPKTIYNRGILTFSVTGRHIRTSIHIFRPKSTYLATVQDKAFFHSCGVKEYHMGPQACDKDMNSINIHGDTVLIYDLDPILVRRIMGKPWFSGGISLAMMSSMNCSTNGQNICHVCGSHQKPNPDYEDSIVPPTDIGGKSTIYSDEERKKMMIKEYVDNHTLSRQSGSKESIILASKKIRNLMYNVLEKIVKSGNERARAAINRVVKTNLRYKGQVEILPVEVAYREYLEYKGSWGCDCYSTENISTEIRELVTIFEDIIQSPENQPKAPVVISPTNTSSSFTTVSNNSSSSSSSSSTSTTTTSAVPIPISFLEADVVNNWIKNNDGNQELPEENNDSQKIEFAAKIFSFITRFITMRLQKNFGGCIRNSPFGFYADSILSDQTSRAMDSLQTLGLCFVGMDVRMMSRFKTIYNAGMVHVKYMRYLDGRQDFSLEEFKTWYYTKSNESQALPYFKKIETNLGFFKKIFPNLPLDNPEQNKTPSSSSDPTNLDSQNQKSGTPITEMLTMRKNENGITEAVVNFSGIKKIPGSDKPDGEDKMLSVTEQKKSTEETQEDDIIPSEEEVMFVSKLVSKLSEIYTQKYISGIRKSTTHRHVPVYTNTKEIAGYRFFFGKPVKKPKKYTTVFNEYERAAFLYYHGKDKDETTEDLLTKLETDPSYASRMSKHAAFSTISRFVLGAITNCISVNADYRTKIPRSYPHCLVDKEDEDFKQALALSQPSDEFLELSKTTDVTKSKAFIRVNEAIKTGKMDESELLSFYKAAYDEKMINLFLSLGYKGPDSLSPTNGLFDIEKLPSKYLLLVWFLINKTNVVQTRDLKPDGTPIKSYNAELSDFKKSKSSKASKKGTTKGKKGSKKSKKKGGDDDDDDDNDNQDNDEKSNSEEKFDANPGDDDFIKAQMGDDGSTPTIFDDDRPDNLPDRVVVFTNGTLYLDALAGFLEKFLGIKVGIYAGSNTVQKDKKPQVLSDFRAGSVHVLIGSFSSLGHGVNLECANVVVTYENWWNPNIEEQAKDRIRRISQKRTCRNAQLTVVGGIDDVISYIGDAKALGAVGSLFRGQSGVKRSDSIYVEHVLFDRPSLAQIFGNSSTKITRPKIGLPQLVEIFSKRLPMFRTPKDLPEHQDEENKIEIPPDALKLAKPDDISPRDVLSLLKNTKKGSSGYYEDPGVNYKIFNCMWKSVITKPSIPSVNSSGGEKKLLNIYLASRAENRQHEYEDDVVNTMGQITYHDVDEIEDVTRVTSISDSDDDESDSEPDTSKSSTETEKTSKKKGDPDVEIIKDGDDTIVIYKKKGGKKGGKKSKKEKKEKKKGKRKRKSSKEDDENRPKKKHKKTKD